MPREGFGIRLCAELIDGLLLLVIGLGLTLVFGVSLMAATGFGTAANPNPAAMAAMSDFLILVSIAGIGYTMTEAFMAASPGKMILGLKIANQDGTPASPTTLTWRWALKNIGKLFALAAALTGIAALHTAGGLSGIVIMIGCFFALGAARQALHDTLAQTAVFRKVIEQPRGFEVLPTTPTPPAA